MSCCDLHRRLEAGDRFESGVPVLWCGSMHGLPSALTGGTGLRFLDVKRMPDPPAEECDCCPCCGHSLSCKTGREYPELIA